MVNLIAGRAVVPELMQGQMSGESLAREEMKAGLASVKEKLSQGGLAAPARAAALIDGILEGQIAHAS